MHRAIDIEESLLDAPTQVPMTVGRGYLPAPEGPRPDVRLLRQPALEGLTRSARTDSPRRSGRNEFPAKRAATAAAWGGGRRRLFERREAAATQV
ncbi:hypothetical protein F511_30196 [Dorcoceras hygrometricum]|uniref:Uncharacterized protein n=1 Tax=Dorcoceras hygrometricum TaxID=472368 RepID=A0A2Z7CQ45_9LAMI|nr:hypothetical protein F511_30196 [Dorcoceras hygrometricum]